MKHPRAALAVLLVGMVLSYAWHWAPEDMQGLAHNIASALLAVALLVVIALTYQSPEVLAAAGLICLFKAMVIGCSVWYWLDPWEIRPGQAMCSARLDAPLGAIGLGMGAVLLGFLTSRGGKNG